jgi:hypothetical protein
MLRILKYTKEFNLILQQKQVNFQEFKLFLVQFGLVNTPDNKMSQDYKLTHELWKSLSRSDFTDKFATANKNHIFVIV